MKRGGFMLIEALLALGLSLLVIVAGAEMFILAQRFFFRIKVREEAGQGALAALDRIRIDLLHAGFGLAGPAALGLLEAASATDAELRLVTLESRLILSGPALAGEFRVPLASTAGVAAGQTLCFADGSAGELRTVASVEGGSAVLAQALERDYLPGTADVSLLETIAYFLDEPAGILRRRVNGGSAQPLLENARAAVWRYEAGAHLVRIRLEIEAEGATTYEATVFLKNEALLERPGT